MKLTVRGADEVLGVERLAAVASPVVGMRVLKSGWRTGVSDGRIQQVNGNDVFIERLALYPPDFMWETVEDLGGIWVEAGMCAPVALHCQETAVEPRLTIAANLERGVGKVGPD